MGHAKVEQVKAPSLPLLRQKELCLAMFQKMKRSAQWESGEGGARGGGGRREGGKRGKPEEWKSKETMQVKE